MYNRYNFEPKILNKEKASPGHLLGEALVPFLIIFLSLIWLV